MTLPNFHIDGRVALVTGAGRGIGRGIAHGLAAAGAAVAIQDIDLVVAQAAANEIKAEGGRAVGLGGDITDLALPELAIRETQERLRRDCIYLVNNASIQHPMHWLDVTVPDIERDLRADLVSPLLFCQHAVRVFREQKFRPHHQYRLYPGQRRQPAHAALFHK